MRPSIRLAIGVFALVMLSLSWLLQSAATRGADREPAGSVPLGFYIPQFGHGVPPGSNLLFATEVNVINLQEGPASFRIRTYGPNGSPLAMLRQENQGGGFVAAQDLERQVAGRGTERLVSFANPGSLVLGWAFVTSIHAIGVEVVFNIFNATTGELLTATNVRSGIIYSEASFFAFNQFREGAVPANEPAGARRRVRSGVALLNPLGNIAPARVQLSVFDRSGEALGQAELTLALGQRVSMFLDQLVSGLPDFEGSVRLRSFNPNDPEQGVLIGVMPLRQEDLVLTTQVVLPSVLPEAEPVGEGPPLRVFWIPQFGHGIPPGSNFLFTTEVNLINLDDAPSTFRIEAYDESGNPLSVIRRESGGSVSAVSALNGEIGYGGTARVDSAIGSGLGLGWAVITTEDFVGAEVVFNIFDATTGELLTSTNVALTPIITAVSFLAFDQTREGAQEAGRSPQGVTRRVRSGLAFLNPIFIPGITENKDAEVNLYALDKSGTIVGETVVILEPGDRRSMFIDQLIPDLPADFEGTIEIRSDDPLDIMNAIPIGVLPLRQEGIILTTQALFPPRVLRERR